ncbi:MAG TPA: dihydrolipoyl dehydrogenase [Desulfovibrio sp.]|uniref:dihydrolipoyl dehydrogenase n=1 Tax=Desulfovibrio sp. TaxID=885 RepID=UPI002D7022DC|nr:dihydrolipoyl dehydrogenase [Desulfovibrio sp.]HZF61397.1 dihydrolipoyl dehydrogenase [Desulfovibrio sp.]
MYDVVVIGGGPGGYAAAIRASQLKGKVALVEGGNMGGTCVMRGCIPSKIWLRAATLLEQSRKAGEFGLELTVGKLDFTAVLARKQGVSNDIRMGMEALLANNGVDVIPGMAVVTSPTSVDVAGKKVEAKSIIIATGSTLAKSEVPGLDQAAFTTDQLLDMTEAPASVLITDPTYIGVEMATLLSILGSKVIYAVPGPRILPDEDQDSSQRMSQSLRERGVQIIARHTLVNVAGKTCTLKSGDKEQTVEADRVLVSGRKPVASNFGLEALGVKFNEDGGIAVDQQCRTACPSIFAIGDCTGGWMLSHAASAMGICAAENSMGVSAKFPCHLVSRAIWGSPEMGSVGLSEEQAERKGYEVEVGGFPYSINGYAMLRGEVDGAVKMVADADTGEILGVHIVGSNASELIGEAVLAMQLECTVREFAKGFRVHPAFCETVVDAARDAAGWALYLPKRG